MTRFVRKYGAVFCPSRKYVINRIIVAAENLNNIKSDFTGLNIRVNRNRSAVGTFYVLKHPSCEYA